jgi:hypothetical protein
MTRGILLQPETLTIRPAMQYGEPVARDEQHEMADSTRPSVEISDTNASWIAP